MKWETVIGLEVHTELATNTKIFCGCSAKFGAEANTDICEVCTGMPGALPILNKKVVEYAIKTGIATNCEISRYTRFDRKNYFYPDLPKAYQISQLYLPICHDGYIRIDTPEGKKAIKIHEIHMEEDAGKLIHDKEENCTLIDFNRCGIPLLEIVTEADFRNADEVIAFVEKLREILQYTGVSDCKMQEGSLRVDVNLSVRLKGQEDFGTRTEMKNLNSFHEIRRAISYEEKRQIELLEKGKKVLQQTRRWDNAKGVSVSMRSKEDAKDYKYFPEPDLTAIQITDEMLESIKASMPELPESKRKRYTDTFGLSEYDAQLLTSDIYISEFFENTVSLSSDCKEIANWILGELLRLLKENCIETKSIPVTPKDLIDIIQMVKENKINRTTAKEVFEKVFTESVEPIKYVQDNNLLLITDFSRIKAVVEEVIRDNEKSVSDYKSGKTSAFGFIVGQTMKALNGKAPVQEVQKILKESLG